MSRARGRHKGMVSVNGVTYRIERIASKTYGVVRLSDDAQIGTFETGRQLRVHANGIDPLLLELIARDAVMSAKTSWVMNPRPSPPSETRSDAEKSEAPVSSRRGFAPA